MHPWLCVVIDRCVWSFASCGHLGCTNDSSLSLSISGSIRCLISREMQHCRCTVRQLSAVAYILHALVILLLRELLSTTHCHNSSSIATGCAWSFVFLHGHFTMRLGCVCSGLLYRSAMILIRAQAR